MTTTHKPFRLETVLELAKRTPKRPRRKSAA